jgi:cytochrome c peroxidase
MGDGGISTMVHGGIWGRLAAIALAAVVPGCGRDAKPAGGTATGPEITMAAIAPVTAAAGDTVEMATEGSTPRSQGTKGKFNPRLLRRFKPVRDRFDKPGETATADRIALGRALYFDKRLSKGQDVSCNSCHDLAKYGVDGEPTSLGHKAQRGTRNSPTVFHAAGYFTQFWDGRAPDVEEQAKGPITNPAEMALPSGDAAVKVLESIPKYRDMFAKAFPDQADPMTFDNVGRAIGAFERGLVSPSRWDKYLAGNEAALTPAEMEGLKVFTNIGCMVCHTGELLGGTSYQKVGAVEPWPNQKDQGRYEVTKNEADRMSFKVPSLRNIEMTGPYFHDGSAKTLEDAVGMMGKHQLGLDLSPDEVRSIVAWLKSLTGELPKSYIAAPTLPPSSNETPKPSLL